MAEETVIILKPKRQDFEEIYLSGNQGSLFFSPSTRGKTITTIVVGLILLILFFFKDDFTKVFLSVSINKVSRWKKQVNSYLAKLENCKIYEITFDNNFFTVNIDGEKETSEWKDFQYFDSNEQYIALEGKYSYMFPKKSMIEKDYNLLKHTLKKNIKE
jgi:hypothetical protein